VEWMRVKDPFRKIVAAEFRDRKSGVQSDAIGYSGNSRRIQQRATGLQPTDGPRASPFESHPQVPIWLDRRGPVPLAMKSPALF
jgi:hypothetical protein